jgi:hypothetical protein
MPKGRSNRDAYECYKEAVRRDSAGAPRVREQQRSRWIQVGISSLFAPPGGAFQSVVHSDWQRRDGHRQRAFGSEVDWAPFADTIAREILDERIRARNSHYTELPGFSAEQIDAASSTLTKLDAADPLFESASYGLSFLALWSAAKSRGLSDEAAAEFIFQWRCNVPARWHAEDARKRRHLPALEPGVQSRLPQVVAWRRRANLYVPWEADVDGHRWQVRLNDFPEEPMYSFH